MPISFQISDSVPPKVAVTGRLVGADLSPFGPGEAVDAEVAALRGFAAKIGESLVAPGAGTVELLIGAGEREKFSPLVARRAAATFARALAKAPEAALDLRGAATGEVPARAVVQAVVEGVNGATYRFGRYKSKEDELSLERLTLVVDAQDAEEARRAVERGLAVSKAICFARDLSNRAPGDLTPRALAEAASGLAEEAGVSIEVLDEEQITAERLGGLLGVARGSSEPPRLVKMTYEPAEGVARRDADGKVPTVVLVGKGITFDSGGLSLKPPDAMIGMKMDMSGAAAVIAAAGACPALGVAVRVVAIAPVTENMPGGRAIKPGDVLTARNGKTIEVLNTDAEGRLVLSDGLVLATEEDPAAIVDIATLTGACVVALGSRIAGLMGNDSHVVGLMEKAAERAGEPVWRLPLPRESRKDIDSDIADMKNMGRPRQAGTLVAGLLLEEFVDERPWAHLDIAGPSDSEEESFDIRKGATGFGIRTLLEFVEGFEPRPTGEDGRPTADHVGVG